MNLETAVRRCPTAFCRQAVRAGPWLDFWRLAYKLVCVSREEEIMNIEVGSYEAKTKLPELLRGVQSGNRYTITLRGEAVAELSPVAGEGSPDAVSAVDDMLSFMQAHPSVIGVDLKEIINEGRV